MKKQIVILLGAPGSGKGTQAKTLSADLQIPHLSTGDLFRENMSKETELGMLAKGYINAGQLVPDEVVLKMLFARTKASDCFKGYLLDGFPRTLPQAESLEKEIKEDAELIVFNLEVPDDVIVRRVAGRYVCQSCGLIHNLGLAPKESDKRCHKCQEPLIQRSDDLAEVVANRLLVYYMYTKPLVEFYVKKGVLHAIDGTKEPDLVHQDILQYL